MKKLVAYFSASQVTKGLAKSIAKHLNCDIYEIVPTSLYTKEDLDYMNKNSRSTLEMNDKKSRPTFIDNPLDISKYDTIYLGFPIWWYTAPRIINTFLEKYDFSNKKIVLFATSGSSGFCHTLEDLKASAPKANFVLGKVNPKDFNWL